MRKVFDTISDFAANAGIVLGGRPVRPMDVDLRWVGAMLFKNGVIEETGLAAGVLNHPATGVAWLANKIAPYGEALEAGDVVLAGSFTRPDARRGRRQLPRRLRPAGRGGLPLRLRRPPDASHAWSRQRLRGVVESTCRRRSRDRSR
jgi:2-keto-4-pentenoate hydratase